MQVPNITLEDGVCVVLEVIDPVEVIEVPDGVPKPVLGDVDLARFLGAATTLTVMSHPSRVIPS